MKKGNNARCVHIGAVMVNWVVVADGEMPVMKVISAESCMYLGLTKKTVLIACSQACLLELRRMLELSAEFVSEDGHPKHVTLTGA